MSVTSKQDELVRRRARRLAREFERQGYEVLTEPEPLKLPEFIAGRQPDLIVHKPGETVIVEITSTPALIEQAAQLQMLAMEIQRHPGWRLELVVTNRRGSSEGEGNESSDYLNKREVYIRLGEIQELLEGQHIQAAFLLLGSVIEATLRFLAGKENIPIQQEGPLYLLKQLFSFSAISRQDYDLLWLAMKQHTRLAYGLRITELDNEWTQELIQTVLRLLRS
ncbi:MAG: hypothetical protein JXA78_17890 [Anaerolineales bacterium]|nr:hypothetical protein [Anaerolineales bacterium]